MVDYILLILALSLIILGIIGCLAPVLPGPPLSYIGLILLHISRFSDFPKNKLISLAAVVIIVTIIDYLIPIWGTRTFGGSKYGMRGAAVGLIIGFFIGPSGIILGPFIGAFVGELIFKDDIKYAIKAGFGSLLGFLTGIGLKLATSLYITWIALKGPAVLLINWIKGLFV
jgi:uncharacterized protein YqgC (DUF456 family)